MDPKIFRTDTQITWTHHKDFKYKATGVDKEGKRFRIISRNWSYIQGLNLWRGNKWLIDSAGKSHKITTIYN